MVPVWPQCGTTACSHRTSDLGSFTGEMGKANDGGFGKGEGGKGSRQELYFLISFMILFTDKDTVFLERLCPFRLYANVIPAPFLC